MHLTRFVHTVQFFSTFEKRLQLISINMFLTAHRPNVVNEYPNVNSPYICQVYFMLTAKFCNMFAHYNFVSVWKIAALSIVFLLNVCSHFQLTFTNHFGLKSPKEIAGEKKKHIHTHTSCAAYSIFSNSITCNAYLYTYIITCNSIAELL